MRSEGDEGGAGRGRHAERGIGRRLVTEIEALAGGRATLLAHRQQAWASITFSGARHELSFAFAGDAAIAAGEALIATVSEHEFAIPGHLVADVAICEVEHTLVPEPRLTVRLEVLTLEDC